MKKIVIIALIGAIAMVSFQSCKKDDSDSGASIVGSWIQVGATEDSKNTWDTDWDDCEKDDITTFSSDGTYKIDEGATKCDPDDPQINETGSWSLSSDKKILTSNGIGFNVVTLTSTDLKISVDLFGSISTASFKKQ